LAGLRSLAREEGEGNGKRDSPGANENYFLFPVICVTMEYDQPQAEIERRKK
jgi:hypothetical protein